MFSGAGGGGRGAGAPRSRAGPREMRDSGASTSPPRPGQRGAQLWGGGGEPLSAASGGLTALHLQLWIWGTRSDLGRNSVCPVMQINKHVQEASKSVQPRHKTKLTLRSLLPPLREHPPGSPAPAAGPGGSWPLGPGRRTPSMGIFQMALSPSCPKAKQEGLGRRPPYQGSSRLGATLKSPCPFCQQHNSCKLSEVPSASLPRWRPLPLRRLEGFHLSLS